MGIGTFLNYQAYLKSVTKGGIASGPEKALYKLHNKSRAKNTNGEHLYTNFKCASHSNCSHEVKKLCYYSYDAVMHPCMYVSNATSIPFKLLQRRCLYDDSKEYFIAEERGEHSTISGAFLPPKRGMNTQSTQL